MVVIIKIKVRHLMERQPFKITNNGPKSLVLTNSNRHLSPALIRDLHTTSSDYEKTISNPIPFTIIGLFIKPNPIHK